MPNQKKELDAFHAHEALDRTFLVSHTFESFVVEHDFVVADPFLKARAEAIALDLGKFYQEVGVAVSKAHVPSFTKDEVSNAVREATRGVRCETDVVMDVSDILDATKQATAAQWSTDDEADFLKSTRDKALEKASTAGMLLSQLSANTPEPEEK